MMLTTYARLMWSRRVRLQTQLAANAREQGRPVPPPAGRPRLEGEQALQRRGIGAQLVGALQLFTIHGEGG
jgi:hypothetical protein